MGQLMSRLCICLLLLLLGWLPVGSVLAADRDEALRLQINRLAGQASAVELGRIWQALQRLSAEQLNAQVRDQNNNYFEQGWFELASDYRLALPPQRSAQLARWQQRWFHHPAMALISRLQQVSTAMPVPERVAHLGVLLPLSGAFAEQGQQVLAGLRAALDWDRRQGYAVPELQVFDAADIQATQPFLQQLARNHQLDMLVGPMQRRLSLQLDSPQPFPVLALNRVGGGRFNGYQLDLASDQELRQLVARMQQAGQRRILLLAPAEEVWVEPLLAWVEQLTAEQGIVIAGRVRYQGTPEQLNQQVQRVLGVQASERRAVQLGMLLGEEPVHEPRRRQDVDAVLLIARPGAARLLKPILNFHQASALPVYASSHLFSGDIDPHRDRDLEGILFCDMPWRLRQRLQPDSSSGFFALGMDAASIYRALPQMQSAVSGYFEGETGNLRLDVGGRLQRTLPCARFRQGVPVLVEAVE